MAKTRRALGRGLSALLPETVPEPAEQPTEADLDRLTPNRAQPRTVLDEPKLEELARSIRGSGVIQPIVVRRIDGGRFEIVAGERRWRAAQMAGLLRAPIVVRDVPDDKLLQMALIENLQREDLNPIEEGEAYRRLIDERGMTQEDIAEAVGKDRATVANYARLLLLPPEVQADVASGALTMGHARALLGLAEGDAQRRSAREVRGRRPLRARDRGPRQEAGEPAVAARRNGGRRPYAGGAGPAARRPRHARPHRQERAQGPHRNRLRVRGRAAAPLRAAQRFLTGVAIGRCLDRRRRRVHDKESRAPPRRVGTPLRVQARKPLDRPVAGVLAQAVPGESRTRRRRGPHPTTMSCTRRRRRPWPVAPTNGRMGRLCVQSCALTSESPAPWGASLGGAQRPDLPRHGSGGLPFRASRVSPACRVPRGSSKWTVTRAGGVTDHAPGPVRARGGHPTNHDEPYGGCALRPRALRRQSRERRSAGSRVRPGPVRSARRGARGVEAGALRGGGSAAEEDGPSSTICATGSGRSRPP